MPQRHTLLFNLLRRATGLRTLAILTICIPFIAGSVLTGAASPRSAVGYDHGGQVLLDLAHGPHGVDITELSLDRDGADVPDKSAVQTARPADRNPSEPMRVCGVGPQQRLTDIAMTFIEGFNNRDLSAWRSVLADDFTAAYTPTGTTVLDQEGAEAVNQAFLAAFSNFEFTVERILVSASCDAVAIYWTATGTHDGPLLTPGGNLIEATLNSGTVPGVYTAVIADGQIVHESTHWDQLSMYLQLEILDPF